MTLKVKILIGYGVAFAFMALVVAWAVSNPVSLGKATDATLHENYRSILAAARKTVRKAIAADPGQSEAYNLLGALLEIDGDMLMRRNSILLQWISIPGTNRPEQI